jgi:hypothetical protein
LQLSLVLLRLGYGWLGLAFDGFGAIMGISQPSHFQTAGFDSFGLASSLSRGSGAFGVCIPDSSPAIDKGPKAWHTLNTGGRCP